MTDSAIFTLSPAALLILGDAEHFEQVWNRAAGAGGSRNVDLIPLGEGPAREASRQLCLERAASRRSGYPVRELPDGVIRIECDQNDQASQSVEASLRALRSQLKEEDRYNIERRAACSDLARFTDAVRGTVLSGAVHATGRAVAIRPSPKASYTVEALTDANGELTTLIMRRQGTHEAVTATPEPTAAATPEVAPSALADLTNRVNNLTDAVNTISAGVFTLIERSEEASEEAASPKRRGIKKPA